MQPFEEERGIRDYFPLLYLQMQKKNGLGFKSGNNTYAAHIYNITDQ
jgi:hypothetical protein